MDHGKDQFKGEVSTLAMYEQIRRASPPPHSKIVKQRIHFNAIPGQRSPAVQRDLAASRKQSAFARSGLQLRRSKLSRDFGPDPPK